MKRAHRVAAVLAAAVWLGASSEAAPASARVALVIGNGDYARFGNLRNPANDARTMAKKLQSLGFSLVGGGAHVNVTRPAMARLLRELEDALAAEESGAGTTALVYYSGHGVAEAGSNWLVPVDDGDIRYREDVPDFAIGARSVMRRLEGRGGGLNILILDACRNNPLPSRRKTKGALSKGLARMDAPSNTVIVYAAAPGRVAYDGSGALSPFTGALLEEMDRPGRRLMDVLGATAAVVERETSGMPEGRQEPWLEMKPLQQPFYFVPPRDVETGPGPVAGGATLAADEAKNAYDTAVSENTIAAYRAVVEHFPGFYATLARRKVEEFEAAAVAAERRVRRQALAEKLGREFSPEAVGENGWTDLHWAAALDLPGLAKELVERGMEVDIRLNESGEPFGDGLKRTLRELGWDFGKLESDGETPLAMAAFANALSVAKYLVGQGADVNAKDSDGSVPLRWAASGNALSVAKFLVAQGADVNAKDNNAITPLHSAAYENALSVAKYLVGQGADVHAKRSDGGTPLHEAAHQNAIAVAKYLIGQGADVDAKSSFDWPMSGTPLHMASYGNALSVAKYLVGQGANIKSKEARFGRTPLHSAADGDALSVAKYLVGQGANIKSKDAESGWTPLQAAAYSDALAVAEYLVAEGADVNAKAGHGWTPLHAAARNYAQSVVEYLVGQGADVHAKTSGGWSDGMTPLHFSALGSDLSTAEYLVGQGADVNAKRSDGMTPLHFGVSDRSMVEYLVGQDANVNAKNDDGDTPLDVALKRAPRQGIADLKERLLESAETLRRHGGRCATQC